jgi:hypothetical protein
MADVTSLLFLFLVPTMQYAQNHGDPYVIVPFIMSHVPPELKPTWPPVPWLVRKVLVPYMFARRHAGYAFPVVLTRDDR